MKKKWIRGCPIPIHVLKKAFLIMRLTFLLTVMFCLSTWATSVAQESMVTLQMKDASLEQVILELREQTGMRFFYSIDKIKSFNHVSIQAKGEKLADVLNRLLEGTGLTYTLLDDVVVIKDAVLNQKKDSAKNITVKGVVRDVKKQPIPGVTVRLKGSSIGTATDVDGRFSLPIPSVENQILVFSFVGMEMQEVKYIGQDSINVILKEEVNEMDEVVITGYQKIDKRYNTSAIQTLKMDEIKVAGVQTVDKLLESQVPGMIFMQNSGQVGAAPKIRVRGTSTVLGNQEPVWVLDGIVLRDPVNVSPSLANSLDFVNLVGNAISGINPEDIERIDILKDASATALYGAKAANGVIVITTKKGKVGPPSVSYSLTGTFTARPRYTDKSIYLMNSKERIDYSREIMEKGLSFPTITNWVGYEGVMHDYYAGKLTSAEMVEEIARLETVNTDWLGEVMQDEFSLSHTLSLSGGTDNIRYYASLGYSNENGVIKRENNKRYTGSLNLNGQFDKFSFSFGLVANKGERNYTNSEINVLDYAYYTSRAIPVRNEDGSLYYYDKVGGPNGIEEPLAFNVLNEMDNARDVYNSSGFTLTTDLSYRLNESLKGQFVFSYAISNTQQESFLHERTWYAANLRGTNYGVKVPVSIQDISLLPYGGEYREANTRSESYTTRLQVDYSKFLDEDGKHLINAALGFEASSSTYNGKSQTHRGYIPERGKMFVSVDPLTYSGFANWKMTDASARGEMTDDIKNELSAYLSLTYTYNNAYTFNFNTRADASNKFGSRSNEKLLPVWSVSASWNTKSDVLKNVDWVNVLSLRGSFGYQGNMLDNQTPELIISKGDMNNYFDEYESSIEHYPNPNLRWEKTMSINGTVDFSFLNDRLRGTVSYFYKKTKDAFLSKSISDINGREEYVINSGTLENKGFELGFNFTPIKSSGEVGAFRWDIDPQLGQVVNTLLTKAVNGNNFDKVQDEIFYSDYLNGSALVKGKPLNSFFSYRFKGLSTEDGRPEFYRIDKEEVAEKYLNMEREDVFMEVMEHSGTRVPVLQGGISNTISYKHLTLNIMLGYSLGSKIRLMKLYGANESDGTIAPLPERNVRREFVHRWKHPGDEMHTNIPGLLPNSEYALTLNPWWANYDYASIKFADNIWQMYDDSNVRVASGDYLKLQSFSLNYSFSEKFCKRLYLKSASLGLSGTNIFTWCSSKLKGQDPTQSGTSDQLNLSLRPTYSINLRVSF